MDDTVLGKIGLPFALTLLSTIFAVGCLILHLSSGRSGKMAHGGRSGSRRSSTGSGAQTGSPRRGPTPDSSQHGVTSQMQGYRCASSVSDRPSASLFAPLALSRDGSGSSSRDPLAGDHPSDAPRPPSVSTSPSRGLSRRSSLVIAHAMAQSRSSPLSVPSSPGAARPAPSSPSHPIPRSRSSMCLLPSSGSPRSGGGSLPSAAFFASSPSTRDDRRGPRGSGSGSGGSANSAAASLLAACRSSTAGRPLTSDKERELRHVYHSASCEDIRTATMMLREFGFDSQRLLAEEYRQACMGP